tara:strand:+ start:1737 stop:2060 length:324 start_codon:yes stop_codon:yes gene_type:complete
MIYIVKYLRCGETGVKAYVAKDKALKEFFENLECFNDEVQVHSEVLSLLGCEINNYEIDNLLICASKDGQTMIEATHDNCYYVSIERLKKPRKIIDWIEMINRNFEL